MSMALNALPWNQKITPHLQPSKKWILWNKIVTKTNISCPKQKHRYHEDDSDISLEKNDSYFRHEKENREKKTKPTATERTEAEIRFSLALSRAEAGRDRRGLIVGNAIGVGGGMPRGREQEGN